MKPVINYQSIEALESAGLSQVGLAVKTDKKSYNDAVA